mgnify:CR=1 FL=1
MGDFERGSRRSDDRGPRRSFGPRRDGFRSFEPREKHKAICSECKKECEVPFKPTEGKPVFCQECYRKKKGF